ncbi:MAG: response regulator [Acidobacteriaceae bacterium]
MRSPCASQPVTRQPVAKRILIADHPLSSRELLRSMLEADGYDVCDAEDGEQVLQRASTLLPQLILLDLLIPKLDGYQTASALRKMQIFQTTPLIALAAAWSDAAPERIFQAGFTCYLVKPVLPAQLRKCLSGLLSPAG